MLSSLSSLSSSWRALAHLEGAAEVRCAETDCAAWATVRCLPGVSAAGGVQARGRLRPANAVFDDDDPTSSFQTDASHGVGHGSGVVGEDRGGTGAPPSPTLASLALSGEENVSRGVGARGRRVDVDPEVVA